MEAKGDLAKAEVVLRKRGIASAGKKASRATKQGLIGTYIHPGGQLGVMVEVNCESDFVARTDDFQELVHDLAMHIAAADPQFHPQGRRHGGRCSRRRRTSSAPAPCAEGKPEKMLDKIVEGRMASSTKRSACSNSRSSRKTPLTIGQLVKTKIAKLGENISHRALRPLQSWRYAAAAEAGSEEPAERGTE